MAIYDVELLEPCRPLTVDTTAITADATSPTADTISYSVDDSFDGITGILGVLVEPADAADVLDAEIIAAELPVTGGGWVRPPRPFPVEGYGFGVLPELEGEAHGVVAVVGAGLGELPRLG